MFYGTGRRQQLTCHRYLYRSPSQAPPPLFVCLWLLIGTVQVALPGTTMYSRYIKRNETKNDRQPGRACQSGQAAVCCVCSPQSCLIKGGKAIVGMMLSRPAGTVGTGGSSI